MLTNKLFLPLSDPNQPAQSANAANNCDCPFLEKKHKAPRTDIVCTFLLVEPYLSTSHHPTIPPLSFVQPIASFSHTKKIRKRLLSSTVQSSLCIHPNELDPSLSSMQNDIDRDPLMTLPNLPSSHTPIITHTPCCIHPTYHHTNKQEPK